MPETEALSHVEITAYDATWPARYAAERIELLNLGGGSVVHLEHIGSTAVPGLQAKPIIDMMAAVGSLADGPGLAARLAPRGYRLIKTGMSDRLFLRRRDGALAFQLHIVEPDGWAERHERLMRDYLIGHPQAAAAYGALKLRLAAEHANDSLGYTRAKTAFIQDIVDKARAGLGLEPVEVWPD